MITFDCASPFLATANGQVYIQNETPMTEVSGLIQWCPSVDDKKYATDTRTSQDAVLQDGILKNFEDSPVTDGMLVKDICVYKLAI